MAITSIKKTGKENFTLFGFKAADIVFRQSAQQFAGTDTTGYDNIGPIVNGENIYLEKFIGQSNQRVSLQIGIQNNGSPIFTKGLPDDWKLGFQSLTLQYDTGLISFEGLWAAGGPGGEGGYNLNDMVRYQDGTNGWQLWRVDDITAANWNTAPPLALSNWQLERGAYQIQLSLKNRNSGTSYLMDSIFYLLDSQVNNASIAPNMSLSNVQIAVDTASTTTVINSDDTDIKLQLWPAISNESIGINFPSLLFTDDDSVIYGSETIPAIYNS